jgi:hypothetical protein
VRAIDSLETACPNICIPVKHLREPEIEDELIYVYYSLLFFASHNNLNFEFIVGNALKIRSIRLFAIMILK